MQTLSELLNRDLVARESRINACCAAHNIDSSQIIVGTTKIRCKGIGYPQWKDRVFTVTRGVTAENSDRGDQPYVGIKPTDDCGISVNLLDFDIV